MTMERLVNIYLEFTAALLGRFAQLRLFLLRS
jgi:hypothetical protein